ncbi:MAG: GAF domain-containing sensor histidine kinase [Chloroflexota bacterium]|nr:GAF domain-containing sensor histidine kinase [Chloroflexota bacterium]
MGYDPLDVTLVTLSYTLIPASIGIAILRFRLWDIDLIINRTLVYGALTAGVVGLYVLVVGGASALLRTGDNVLVSLVATGLIAVLFQPLRERLQRGVNRLLYGERDDPYAVLARLGQHLEVSLAPEAVLSTIVDNVAQALKLPRVAIWLCDGDMLRLGALHGGNLGTTVLHDAGATETLVGGARSLQRSDFDPAGAFHTALAGHGTDLVLPLTHRGELVGALCLASWSPGDKFSPADVRLLRDLASQCGAAAHAVQLTATLRANLEELRRSRERLVVAQEEERRRIQRDLHDGLGPTLASMRFRLEACLALAEGASPSLIGMLERLDDLVGQATADIRRLVYDLRPPALDQLGLVPALQQHVERFSRETGIAVHFSVEPDLAVPPSAEVSILRIVQEALVNVRKHAQASQVDVRLRREHGELVLEIGDDGVGFGADGTAPGGGTGLASMRERAELLGGTLSLARRAGGGAELIVRVPLVHR